MTAHARRQTADERTLQRYERAIDALVETLWDDTAARDAVLDKHPAVVLELVVARVKTLRMEARTLRNEVHELEDARLELLRGVHRV